MADLPGRDETGVQGVIQPPSPGGADPQTGAARKEGGVGAFPVEAFDAVLFDLDGVMTRTADIHAWAWKRLFDEILAWDARGRGEPARDGDTNGSFEPFDEDADYRRFVDGKPRMDGLTSFLDARQIAIDAGTQSDEATAWTLQGLARRKDDYFHQLLDEKGVDVFPGSLEFVESVRRDGLKLGLISSSKNTPAILAAAGIDDIFDVVIDGNVAEREGLKGKPDPAIFLTAADRLGVKPARTAVIEDAVAGVQAGCRGGFAMVVGVNRSGATLSLRQAGAHLVVSDLAELLPAGGPPLALDCMNAIENRLKGRRAVVFLDYDGTVSPIVDRPEDAVIPGATKEAIEVLAEATTVAFISGRMKEEVKGFVGLDNVIYAGSHGFTIEGPGGLAFTQEDGAAVMPVIAASAKTLQEELGSIKGILVEDKTFAVAVHFRLVAEDDFPRIEAAVDRVVEQHKDVLRKSGGKMVFELRPRIDWHKGKAVTYLLDEVGLGGDTPGGSSGVMPFYLGDDVTDEDAFASLKGRGIGILVSDRPAPTSAMFRLRSTDEVRQFLEELTSRLDPRDSGSASGADGSAMTDAGIPDKASDVSAPEADNAQAGTSGTSGTGGTAHASAPVADGTEDPAWVFGYDDYDPENQGLRETLLTVGNGRFATRGAFSEAQASDVHYPGTYLAGGFNRLVTEVSGQDIENEDLVNTPNWAVFTIRPEGGEWLDLDRAEILSFSHKIDLRAGVMIRTVRVRDKDDRITRVTERRLVHMAKPHLAAQSLTVTAENWSGGLDMRAAVDGTVINRGVPRYRDLNSNHVEPMDEGIEGEDILILRTRLTQSRVEMVHGARIRLYDGDREIKVARTSMIDPGYVGQDFQVRLEEGRPVSAEKIVALYTSKDWAISEPGLSAFEAVLHADRFASLEQEHRNAWSRLWTDFNTELKLSPNGAQDFVGSGGDGLDANGIIRLHLFHLLQTCSPNMTDLDGGAPARGLHGEAYRGHIFWDEIYILPILTHRAPDIARAALMYRHRRLDAARSAAREAGYRGAMFPWQSGSDGSEESQQIHLNPQSGHWVADNSRIQRHVNAAIAYNVWTYFHVTGDREFMGGPGADLLLEIARFWASLATWNASRGRYEILGVMGPDEFHDGYPDQDAPGVDNNAYTNILAAWILSKATDFLEVLDGPDRDSLMSRLALTQEEIGRWDEISRKMFVPFHTDPEVGEVLSQFEGYGDLKDFDWEGYAEKYGDIHRLDRLLEAEGDTPNRYKVSKQADTLMLYYLFKEEELKPLFERLSIEWDEDLAERTVAYYLPRTSHGSTLSRLVHAWVLARLGDGDGARSRGWDLFKETLLSDVTDIQGGTTREGIHLGAMAGSVDLLHRCYGGLSALDGALSIDPVLPPDIERLSFTVRYRGSHVAITVDQDEVKLRVNRAMPEAPLRVYVRGQEHEPAWNMDLSVSAKTGQSLVR